jgi:hypothetical protein
MHQKTATIPQTGQRWLQYCGPSVDRLLSIFPEQSDQRLMIASMMRTSHGILGGSLFWPQR